LDDVGFEEPGGTAVLPQQFAEAPGDDQRFVFSLPTAFLDFPKALFDAFFEAGVHRFFFFAAVAAAAEDEGFVAVETWALFHFEAVADDIKAERELSLA
jgi:hypothetical protein